MFDLSNILLEEWEKRAKEIFESNNKVREEYEIRKKELEFSAIMKKAWVYNRPQFMGHRWKNWIYII